MSDDGYYPDSPYDEFEEMLWDADPAPNLADDLAQHAAYSPVWQDDPIGELEQYHSDWEYYSDDYFDDDPAILMNNPMEGSPIQKKKISRPHPAQRGRKRKVSEIYQAAHSVEMENKFLTETIQGTVWAKDSLSGIKVFHNGQQDKVALLTDWRERFQLTNTKSRPDTTQSGKDESWANDLSLQDMGLTNGREGSATQTGGGEEEENDVYTDEDDVENEDREHAEPALSFDDQMSLANEDGSSNSFQGSPQHNRRSVASIQNASPNADSSDPKNTEETKGFSVRKKRKLLATPEPLDAHDPQDSISSRLTRSSKLEQLPPQETATAPEQAMKTRSSRKRKLSHTEDENSDTIELTAKLRSKRPASARSKTNEINSKLDTPRASKSPRTRAKSRKK